MPPKRPHDGGYPKRGTVVLWAGRGLYVSLGIAAGTVPALRLLDLAALEGQGDAFAVHAWKVQEVIRPTPEHAETARRRTE